MRSTSFAYGRSSSNATAGQAERALANVDLYLGLSRAFAVRGLRAFAEAMTAAWTDESRAVEGRPRRTGRLGRSLHHARCQGSRVADRDAYQYHDPHHSGRKGGERSRDGQLVLPRARRRTDRSRGGVLARKGGTPPGAGPTLVRGLHARFASYSSCHGSTYRRRNQTGYRSSISRSKTCQHSILSAWRRRSTSVLADSGTSKPVNDSRRKQRRSSNAT